MIKKFQLNVLNVKVGRLHMLHQLQEKQQAYIVLNVHLDRTLKMEFGVIIAKLELIQVMKDQLNVKYVQKDQLQLSHLFLDKLEATIVRNAHLDHILKMDLGVIIVTLEPTQVMKFQLNVTNVQPDKSLFSDMLKGKKYLLF